jgi:hypothetical protein
VEAWHIPHLILPIPQSAKRVDVSKFDGFHQYQSLEEVDVQWYTLGEPGAGVLEERVKIDTSTGVRFAE